MKREPVIIDGYEMFRSNGPDIPDGERPANRRERRAYVKGLPRALRKAYGFGQVLAKPPGMFVTPAKPREINK